MYHITSFTANYFYELVAYPQAFASAASTPIPSVLLHAGMRQQASLVPNLCPSVILHNTMKFIFFEP